MQAVWMDVTLGRRVRNSDHIPGEPFGIHMSYLFPNPVATSSGVLSSYSGLGIVLSSAAWDMERR